MKKILFLCLFVIAYQAISQNTSTTNPRVLKNNVRLSFLSVEMPIDEFPQLDDRMGIVGLRYQVPINNWLYAGAGFHKAITGDQGGLFTLGVELGATTRLVGNLHADANFHFAGGGGYRFLVNDGALINASAGVKYKFNDFAVGLAYNHFNFYTGEIEDNAVSIFVDVPSLFKVSDYKDAGKQYDLNLDNELWNEPAVKTVLMGRLDVLHTMGDSKDDRGNDLQRNLYSAGFEYQKYLKSNTYLYVRTDAIYKGLRAGYMDIFLGGGYNIVDTNYLNLFTKFAIGAGGGRVFPEGGLTIWPEAGLDLKLHSKIYLTGRGGYYRALDGDLEAYTYGVGLKYVNLVGGSRSPDNSSNIKTKSQGIRVELQNQTYLDIAKTDSPNGLEEVDLQLLAVKFNFDLSPYVYLTGETGFAYAGESGGYAHGMGGLGFYSPSFFNDKARFYGEFLGGAAGGAGVDTGEGIVMRPTIGLLYVLDPNLSLVVSGGRFIALDGDTNSTNFNIGLSFNFSSLWQR
ncbi:hypothetical protein [Nonlabens ponticola]|uniref:Bacterial surface antigen (D15) domain-containing protein n=1 Tax=Nonlabens ponticola TaxID=2496866 RepID=A0A3S9MUX3_9FLAO|nr:hypothetical protein [Nonlabens ponticola]AZQ42968.1 hypothetical protein EJ995_01470 [Nonlabens ponticola]